MDDTITTNQLEYPELNPPLATFYRELTVRNGNCLSLMDSPTSCFSIRLHCSIVLLGEFVSESILSSGINKPCSLLLASEQQQTAVSAWQGTVIAAVLLL